MKILFIFKNILNKKFCKKLINEKYEQILSSFKKEKGKENDFSLYTLASLFKPPI